MSQQDDIRSIFIEEAQDIIQRILDDLQGFLTAPDRAARFNSILRGIHTIKGGAATCSFPAIKDEAHNIETELQDFKTKPEALTDAEVQRILRTLDRFEALLNGEEITTETSTAPSDGGLVLFDEPAPETKPAPAPVAVAAAPSAETSGAKAKQQSEVIRVPLDRVQKNFDAISEIFLTRNQLRHLAEQRMEAKINDETFFRQWEMLDSRLRQNIRDLEHNAMAMRLTSVKSLMRRMEKTVRSFADESGKDIGVELVGEDTELDKLIVDSLAEPLVHLVRNAMDHGVEPPAERLKNRKKPAATIRIEAAIEGNEAVIRTGDDGRGMDPAKILESARKKGLDVSGITTRDEMLNLIFLPGFSTRDTVSEVSGRGVGMDAVKSYVNGLGGHISIQTEAGVGTTFTMRLPLGLSVIPAILAIVNGKRFAISTTDVVEVFKAPRRDITDNDGETFYRLRGQFIPCLNLNQHIFVTSQQQLARVEADYACLCVVESSHGLIAMQFDYLESNVEIALKTMPARAARFPYVTGVSTLATGEAVCVFSLSRLFEHIKASARDELRAEEARRAAA